jgi:hypothetical protein
MVQWSWESVEKELNLSRDDRRQFQEFCFGIFDKDLDYTERMKAKYTEKAIKKIVKEYPSFQGWSESQRERAETVLQPLTSIWKSFKKSGKLGKEKVQQENSKTILRQDRMAESGQIQMPVEKVQLEADTSESQKGPARSDGATQLPIDEVQLQTEVPKSIEISTSNEEKVDLDFSFSPLRSRKIGELAVCTSATMRVPRLSTTSNTRSHPEVKISTTRSRERRHRRSTSLPVDCVASIAAPITLQASHEQQSDTTTATPVATAVTAKGPVSIAISLAQTSASTSVPLPDKQRDNKMVAGVSAVKPNSCGLGDVPSDREQAGSTNKAAALPSLLPPEKQKEIQKSAQAEIQPSSIRNLEAAPTDQTHHMSIPTSSISPSCLVPDQKAEMLPALSAVLTSARHNALQTPLPSGSSTAEPSTLEREARLSAPDKPSQSLHVSGSSRLKGVCDVSVRNEQNQPLPAAASPNLEPASEVSALNKQIESLPTSNLKRSFIAFNDNKIQPGFATTSTPPDIRRRRLASSAISMTGALQAKDKNRKITGGTGSLGLGKGLEEKDMITKPKPKPEATSASIMHRRRLANVFRDPSAERMG